MATALLLGTGLCWTLTYLLIIWRGLADRTYGMPLVALCANLSWEFIFSAVRPPSGVLPHTVDAVWFAFDLVIAYTALRYGPSEFAYLPRPVFYLGFAATLGLAYAGTDLVSRQFDAGRGSYPAFASNLMMSGLFLGMLAARRGLRGQSVWIAAAKLAGTGFASLYSWRYGVYPHSILMPFLYLANAAVDVAYLAAVLAVGRRAVVPRDSDADRDDRRDGVVPLAQPIEDLL